MELNEEEKNRSEEEDGRVLEMVGKESLQLGEIQITGDMQDIEKQGEGEREEERTIRSKSGPGRAESPNGCKLGGK